MILAPWLSAYEEGRGLVTADGSVLDEYINSGEAQVLSRSYRGNEIRYHLKATTDGEITLGMGYDDGWEIVKPVNSQLRAEQGLLAVSFSAGDSELYLRYRTPYFYTGLLISLLSIVAFFVLGIWLKKPSSATLSVSR